MKFRPRYITKPTSITKLTKKISRLFHYRITRQIPSRSMFVLKFMVVSLVILVVLVDFVMLAVIWLPDL